MNDLITIIINCYNQEKYIEKCLDSVIGQTYKNLEILIINNASTDNTLKLCKDYQKKDKRIKIITSENVTLSVGRNIGIENANGKYLYFVDSDDYISKDVIEYLYNLINKYKVKIATCRPYIIYDYNYKEEIIEEKVEIIDSEAMLKKVLLIEDKAGTTWNKLIDKNLFIKHKFEDRIVNDMNVMHKIIIEAKKIAYSNQKKYYYLLHSNSVTAKEGINLKRLIDKYEVSVDRYNYIKKYYPNMMENDIFLINNTILLYLFENKELDEFLNKNKAYEKIKSIYSFKKLFFYKFSVKQKIRIILFFINKNFCKYINRIHKKYFKNYKL